MSPENEIINSYLSIVFVGCGPNTPKIDVRSVLQENKNPKFLVEAHVIFDTPRYYSSDGKTHHEEYRIFGVAGDVSTSRNISTTI